MTSTNNSKIFPLKNPEKRKKNTFIILSHIRNFSLRKNSMTPDLKGFLPYYVTNKHKDYYFENLENRHIPFHFHCNKILNDWETIVTAPIRLRSNMLEEAFKAGYIENFYTDAIVIAVQDAFDIRIPELRLYEVLGANVLAPLREELKMPNYRSSIFWLDEIFNIEKYNKDMEENRLHNTYPYEFRPMRYFDRVQFNLEVTRFI